LSATGELGTRTRQIFIVQTNAAREVAASHLATMADLHRAGRYDRMWEDVRTLTGQGPQHVQEFVRNNAAHLSRR